MKLWKTATAHTVAFWNEATNVLNFVFRNLLPEPGVIGLVEKYWTEMLICGSSKIWPIVTLYIYRFSLKIILRHYISSKFYAAGGSTFSFFIKSSVRPEFGLAKHKVNRKLMAKFKIWADFFFFVQPFNAFSKFNVIVQGHVDT